MLATHAQQQLINVTKYNSFNVDMQFVSRSKRAARCLE